MSVLPIIRNLLQRLGLVQPTVKAFGQPFALPSTDFLWHETYVWYPVVPFDEGHVFWLETVWRRRNRKTASWEYRSFRDEATKLRELMDREI